MNSRERELPRDIYKRLKENTPSDIHSKILEVITPHDTKENRISRLMLVSEVFGVDLPPSTNLANLTQDRQIRRAIKALSEYYPILGSSALGGYWLSKSKSEILAVARENEIKANNLMHTTVRLRSIAENFEVAQPSLFS